MNKHAFLEGMEFDALRSKQDIKILICYMLDKIGDMYKQDILSALQAKGLANYFEAGEAFSDLVYGDNIEIKENTGKFTLKKSGKLISDQLYLVIPLSIRERALDSGINTLKMVKNEEENKVKIEKNKFGYSVACSISGGDFELLSFTLYVPDIEQAEKVKKNFRKDPVGIYHAVLSVMTRKKEISDKLKNGLSDLMK